MFDIPKSLELKFSKDSILAAKKLKTSNQKTYDISKTADKIHEKYRYTTKNLPFDTKSYISYAQIQSNNERYEGEQHVD